MTNDKALEAARAAYEHHQDVSMDQQHSSVSAYIDALEIALQAMQARAEAAERERDTLRAVVSECASALPNGAFVSPQASLEFMAMLPAEIASVCTALKGGAEAAEARVKELEATLSRIDELNTLPPDENGHRWANSDLINQEIVFSRTGGGPNG